MNGSALGSVDGKTVCLSFSLSFSLINYLIGSSFSAETCLENVRDWRLFSCFFRFSF